MLTHSICSSSSSTRRNLIKIVYEEKMGKITKYLRDTFEALVDALHFHCHVEEITKMQTKFVLDYCFVNLITRKIVSFLGDS